MNISAKFQLHRLMALRKWQPIKVSGLDIIYMVGSGLLKEHICNSFVKISSVR